MQIKRNTAIASAGVVGVGLLVVGSYAASHRGGIKARLARRVPARVAQTEGVAAGETADHLVTDVVRVGNLQRRTLVLINKVARREAVATS